MKTPPEILREILLQRGKIVHSINDPFKNTLLRFIKSKKSNRDLLYNELSDRRRRNELLYAIYNNENINLLDKIISPEEHNRNLYSSTFEWYVAELLYREFQFFASAYGVKIDGSPDGGDFDVIGATHSGIMTIECKSGKPRGVDEQQIIHFVKRHDFLRADYSILYIDFKGLEGNFPFSYLANAVHGDHTQSQVYKIDSEDSESNANFYAVEGANIYVVDNSKNTGNVIKNLRFAIDTHYAFKNSYNRSRTFNKDLLKSSYGITLDKV